MFSMMPLMVFLIFAFVISVFVVAAVKGIGEWNNNNHSPRLTVPAIVVAKRTNVSRHHHHHGTNHVGLTSTSTTYYVTFQFASGDRTEMHISGQEYGMLVEGDRGDLTFQGTRYLGFERRYQHE